MQTRIITAKTKNGKEPIGTTHLFTKYDASLGIQTAIESFVQEIPHSEHIGYAGFDKQEHLQDSLSYNIPDFNDKTKILDFNIPEKELLTVVEKALRLCHTNVTTTQTHIFLFPTFSEFVRDNMNGVSGYTPYKNTLLLFVSPEKTDDWEQSLIETVCHEFMHTVMDNHYERKTLLDDLVFEGVAESFVSSLFGEKPHMPSQAFSKQESIEWYIKLESKLRDTELYSQVFLEGKEYPLWAGYAIGYRLVEAYRKQHPRISWNEIVRMTPKEIHTKSGFGI